jgi:hypothetical protein
MKVALNALLSLAAGCGAFLAAMHLTIVAIGVVLHPQERDLGLGVLVLGIGLPIWLLVAIAVALFVFVRLKKRMKLDAQAN